MSDKPHAVTITITGTFSRGELAALAQLLRAIDDRHPDRHYEMVITDPDSTLGEGGEEMMRAILPDVPGRKTVTTFHRKQ